VVLGVGLAERAGGARRLVLFSFYSFSFPNCKLLFCCAARYMFIFPHIHESMGSSGASRTSLGKSLSSGKRADHLGQDNVRSCLDKLAGAYAYAFTP
jgi:hypothetical protein